MIKYVPKRKRGVSYKKIKRSIRSRKKQLQSYKEDCEKKNYLDTPEAQEEVKKMRETIAVLEDEIEAIQVYKETGVYMSSQARQLLKNAKEKKKSK